MNSDVEDKVALSNRLDDVSRAADFKQMFETFTGLPWLWRGGAESRDGHHPTLEHQSKSQ